MSILIKGMEMPKKGEYRMTLYVCDDGYAYMDVDLFPVDKDRFEAVPVQPHGRLIDADMLRELYEQWENDKAAGIEIDKCHVPVPVIRQNIDDAPTVIPAEEGET